MQRKKAIRADAIEYIYARMKKGLSYRDAKDEFDEKFEIVDKAELEKSESSHGKIAPYKKSV